MRYAQETLRYIDKGVLYDMRNVPEAQTEIARTCLTYLLFDIFAEGYCSSDKHMETRLQENPLLRYAALHWGDHARGEPEQIIQELILKFLEEKSKLSCTVQVICIRKYQYGGYTQGFPRNVTGLQVAASFGLEKITSMLLEKGADITAKDGDRLTALHWTAKNGHEAVVRLLVEKGADVAAKDGNGRTALHWAAGNGHEVVVRLLVEKGADVAAKSKGGWTALQLAAENRHEAVVRLLILKP